MKGERSTTMRRRDNWSEEELYDLDNLYNMEPDENYATADSSTWYS